MLEDWSYFYLRSFLLRFCLGLSVFFGGVLNTTSGHTAHKDDDLARIISEVQQVADSVQSFHCMFRQEKELSLFKNTVTFTGELRVDRPDQLRWEFRSPVSSVLLFSGDSGMRCSEKTQPVHFDLKSDPVMRSVAEQLWLWLGGNYDRLSELYRLKCKGDYSISIAPKKASIQRFIQNITISFDPKTKHPQEVVVLEAGGDITRLYLFSYTLNLSFSDSLFTECALDE